MNTFKKVFAVLCASVIILSVGGCKEKQMVKNVDLINPETLTDYFYKNPDGLKNSVDGMVEDGLIGADPFVLHAKDGFYYMYATSAVDGFTCWKSGDLINWEELGHCFQVTSTNAIWAANWFWAPEVVEYKDKYYLFYSASQYIKKTIRLSVAVSDSPSGPFIDSSPTPVFDSFGYAAIDANVLIDDDGRIYMYFSKDMSENMKNGVNTSESYVVELNEDMKTYIGEPKLVITPELSWEWGSTHVWNEGPEIYKYNNKYYLAYSANYYNTRAYSVGYAVSDSPTEGFVKPENNRILYAGDFYNISGTGHHCFTDSPDGKDRVVAYHSHVDPKGGGQRQVNICTMEFTKDGLMHMNGPTICLMPYPSNDRYYNLARGVNGVSETDGDNTEYLFDGLIKMRPKDNASVWTGTIGSKITITLAEKSSIGSIIFFKGDELTMYKGATVTIDGKYKIEMPLFDADDQHQLNAIAAFDFIEGKKIVIEFTGNVSLSEIMIMGKGI